jgi:hypothetical protein
MPWRRGLLLLAAAAGLIGLFLLVRQARRPPAWWQPPPATAETAERGAAIEQALAAAFSRVRPDGEAWTLRLSEDDLNAWLAERLPQWVGSGFLGADPQWPPSLGLVQVHFGEGRVEIAVELLDLGMVARLSAVPAYSREGWGLEWVDAGIGRIDAGIAGERLRGELVARLGELVEAEALAGLRRGDGSGPAAVRLEGFRLADGRRVRIEGGRLREGELELTLATQDAVEADGAATRPADG